MILEDSLNLFYLKILPIYLKITTYTSPYFIYRTLKRILFFWIGQGNTSGWFLALNLLIIWSYYSFLYKNNILGVLELILKLIIWLLSILKVPDWLKRSLRNTTLTLIIYIELSKYNTVPQDTLNLDYVIIILSLVCIWSHLNDNYMNKKRIYLQFSHIYIYIEHFIYTQYPPIRHPKQRKSIKINSKKLKIQHNLILKLKNRFKK